ncbi:hypothetical protein NRY68_05605 [Acidithiobacillus ferrooxidans]|uniref:hypothetical protein n=1 Tax=Acidithiobacillus ferrooxidans TaxID=920 RepID=UPI0021478CEC|nr:hypothetical protein [Acidithiobacillus ferrooxidans]MCR1345281.1 hypothetical protein [Acidithiobacillus ferrooxidans]MCR1354441.1 hypothetical protein [Acidithiobacillus ferrooxidans]
MSNPVICSANRFRWAETRIARMAGWPILVGLWIMIALRFPTVHFAGGFFQNLWGMVANQDFGGWIELAFWPLIACFAFCGDGIETGWLTPLNKGPDWSGPLHWYAVSTVALIFWVAIDGATRTTMPYWILGTTLSLILFFEVLERIIPQGFPQPGVPPKPDMERDPSGYGGLLLVSPWTNLLRGQRLDLWPKYIEEARAAGRDDLANTIQAMLEKTGQ